MQCIWSTATRSTLRSSITHESRSRSHGWRRPYALKPFHTTSRFSTALAQKLETPSSFSDPITLPPPNAPSQFIPLTAAEVSRAAAQAIRVCATSSLTDALYVVNSVHLSSHLHIKQGALDLFGPAHTPASGESTSPQSKPLPFNAIDFGQVVSLRLSAHCFLHALIRAGQYYKAGRYAELMMEQGVRIRSTTLENIVGSLANDPVPAILKGLKLRPRTVAWNGLSIHPEQFTHTGTRAAYRILMHARKFGQDRSERMYDSLIRGCLMQGEIIVGSLLFVLLVKDWQAHAARKKLANEHSDNAESDDSGSGDDCSGSAHLLDGYRGDEREFDEMAYMQQVPRSRESWRSAASTPYPTRQLLKLVTSYIETAMAQEPQTAGDEEYLREPLQALANLTLLVEEGRIHFGHLAPIIRAIYVCPKSRERIWVRKRRKPVQIDGYQYLHDFLLRIIKSFKGADALRVPPLDTRSYNSLLHYTLRHRLSPALASTVLDHMCVNSGRRLKPSIETYNILLRSGTLLRRSDISEAAMQVLQRDQANFGNLVTVVSRRPESEPESSSTDAVVGESMDRPAVRDQERKETETSPSGPSTDSVHEEPGQSVARAAAVSLSHMRKTTQRRNLHCAPVKGKLVKKLQRLQQEEFSLPQVMMSPPTVPGADVVTLTSFIMHLVSTGSPHLVPDVIIHVLPELNVVDHPVWGDLRGEERDLARAESRDVCIRRAAKLGPVFFAVALNALAKAGMTGFAERVWILASEAQRASWIPDFCPGVEPWALSIHAYTAMLQCYANEATKGIPRRFSITEDMQQWVTSHNPRIAGWARFIQKRRDHKRSEAGRELGLILFSSVFNGGNSVFQTLREVRGTAAREASFVPVQEERNQEGSEGAELSRVKIAAPPTVRPPIPDARFFNAALRLIGTQPGMRPRTVRATRSRTRRFLRWTSKIYAYNGWTSSLWTPGLQQIAEAMMSMGYSVPAGYRHLLMGHLDDMYCAPAPALVRVPFAYPRSISSAFRPHSIPTVKSRGLPVRHLPRRKRRTRQSS